MTNFESAIQEIIIAAPFVTAILASIGVAAVAYLIWAGAKPILSYIVSGPRQMMSFWCYTLFVFGGAAWGYAQQDVKGMWQGLGITAVVSSVATVVAYWIRQWVRWYYSEKD